MARELLISKTILAGLIQDEQFPRARQCHVNWIAHRREYISTFERVSRINGRMSENFGHLAWFYARLRLAPHIVIPFTAIPPAEMATPFLKFRILRDRQVSRS